MSRIQGAVAVVTGAASGIGRALAVELARQGAQLFAGTDPGQGFVLKNFPDSFMPFAGAEVKTVFEELKAMVSPDLIFTHNREDAHQDHRLIADLTWTI
jgi:NAD(P)-dependent dehydrogenase (short-subunit alcohol dehydrogenase family)